MPKTIHPDLQRKRQFRAVTNRSLRRKGDSPSPLRSTLSSARCHRTYCQDCRFAGLLKPNSRKRCLRVCEFPYGCVWPYLYSLIRYSPLFSSLERRSSADSNAWPIVVGGNTARMFRRDQDRKSQHRRCDGSRTSTRGPNDDAGGRDYFLMQPLPDPYFVVSQNSARKNPMGELYKTRIPQPTELHQRHLLSLRRVGSGSLSH